MAHRKRLLLLLCAVPFFASTQVLDISVSSPGDLSVCGPTGMLTVTVTANAGLTGSSVTGAVLNFDGGTGLVATPASVNIGTINPGDVLMYNFTIQADCNYNTSVSSSTELPFSVTHDDYGLGNENSANGESNTIQIQEADLSVGATSPTSIDAYNGLAFTVDVTVNNGGNGELEEFEYCITGNVNVELQGITVGGIFLAGAGPCFTIGMAELTGAGEFPFVDAFVVVQESWIVVGCTSPSPTIDHSVSFGCPASPDCDSDDTSTGLIYGVATPELEASVTGITYPACYADVASDVEISITNNGTAPANNIDFTLSAAQDIDLSSLMIVSMGGGGAITPTINSSSIGGCGGSTVDITLEDVDLPAGECLTVSYSTNYDCSCNDCSIEDIYSTSLTIDEWTDYCDNIYDTGAEAEVEGFNARLEGIVEGPLEMLPGDVGTVEYTVNSIELDWLNDSYPNAYIEIEYEIPCGLDYTPGSAIWTDRDGTVWNSCADTYVDTGGDDTFIVRFCQSSRPGGFSTSVGSAFTIEVSPDCAEKTIPPTACGFTIFDLEVDQTTYFSTDNTCAMSCERQKLWDPNPLDIRVSCPATGTCVCEGLVFSQFTMQRATYGEGDSDNNQIPDGALDLGQIQLDRFLQGDTIKTLYEGVVSNPMDEDWRYGFATLDFDHTNFTPISAQLIFHDASAATIDTVNTIPIAVDGMDLILNWSLDTLNSLGSTIDPTIHFEDGDSISLCLNFEIKDLYTGGTRTITYNPSFYLSDDEYGLGMVLSCNDRVGRLTQVGVTFDESNDFENFGGCNLPDWEIEYRRHFGARNFDEFPYEIRPVGLPKTITFTKPTEFEYRFDEFEVQLRQMIGPANNIVETSATIPEIYLIQSGDIVTFLAEDYFNSLGDAEIPPDEGYRIRFYPKIQGGCKSTAGTYSVSYAASESVDQSVYCTPMLMRDEQTVMFNYTDGARLEVETAEANVVLCGGLDTIDLLVNSVLVPDAFNAFLHWNSPNGGAVVTQLIDEATDTEIMANDFGIFPLGTIDGGTSKALRAVVIVNDCASTTVDFVAGWDCETLPTTLEEALCSDPSTVSFTSAPSGMNLNVIAPINDTIVNFCDPIPYEIEIISTELGYLRDFTITGLLPPGQTFQSGSLEIAYPSVSEGGTYVSVGSDPVISGVIFRLDVAALDPMWVENGLIGAKDLDLNKISLRFVTETGCGYISGQRARFLLQGSDNCGDALQPVRKRARRAEVVNTEPNFEGDITLSDLVLNPCNNQQASSFISFELTDGGPTASLDSIQYILPDGLNYVPGSFLPSLNMTTDEPTIRDEGGAEVLVWPLNVGLNDGDVVSFKIDIIASDVGQACSIFDLQVLAYSAVNATCGASTCSYGLIAGEGLATVEIEKPALYFNNFDGALSFPSVSTEQLDVFEVEICNSGAVLQSGQSVTMDIYEDEDMNGFVSVGDTYLFAITQVLSTPLNMGECVTLSGSDVFPSGTVCTIIGVLDPENTCTCSEEPSSQFMPSIDIEFDTEVQTCSGSTISVGPEEIDGFDYEWVSLNGSPLSALSATDQSPVNFTMANQTGSDIELQYLLRSSANNCYGFDTLTVTVSASYAENYTVSACLGGSYNLPSPGVGGSNFSWSPTDGLSFPGPDSSFATIDTVMGDQIYTLNFVGTDGCLAQMTVNVQTLDCGTAAASLGDYVWFDFNEDGVQDDSEPPIAGLVVNLYDGLTGALRGTTTTDENGNYLFGDLIQGSYYVDFEPLPGFGGTMTDQGTGASQDSLDSDADPTTGETSTYYLSWGEYNPTIDAGFIPECTLDVSLSLSDCIVQTDTLTRAVTVQLNWADNPYTYDQFFGADTLSVDLTGIGQSISIVVDTLFGDTTLTFYVNPATTSSLTAEASFAYANACTAMSETLDFDPCIFDLALKKESTNGTTFSYGDTICMDVIVFNQAIQPVSQIAVIDYLPAGFGFLADINPDWTVTGENLSAIIGDTLFFGESDTIPLKVSLLMAEGVDAWTNFAEITAFEDTMGVDQSLFDIDSTPDDEVDNDAGGSPNSASDNVVDGTGIGTIGGTDAGTDEDDHDPLRVEIFDLALRKTIITAPPYQYGQSIDFAITVFNQGNIAAKNIKITDHIPLGFDWDSVNEPSWIAMDIESLDADTAMTTILDTLQAGDSLTLQLSLTLVDADPDQYINIAEIAEAMDEAGNPRFDDIDSTPDNDPTDDAGGNPGTASDNVVNGIGSGSAGDTDPATDEDDHDPAFVSLPLIELTKSTTSVVPAASGTTGNFDVTFQFKIRNSGNTKLTDIQLIDNFPSIFGSGFVALVVDPVVMEANTSVSVPERPTLNTNFNGAVYDSLFIGTDGCILPDDTLLLQLAIEMTALTGVDSVINEAMISSQDTFGIPATDMDTAIVRLPNCFLDVVCPSAGGTYSCLADLPTAANSVATFNAIDGGSAIRNACGPTLIQSSDSNNGGTGCTASPLIITREYIVIDGSGIDEQRDTCEITYTIIDDEGPVLVCPSAVEVDCDINDVPTYSTRTEFEAVGGYISDNCGIASFTFVSQVSDGGTCPETYSRTYRVTDDCNNSTTCIQLVMVKDEESPIISCPDISTDCALSDIPAYADLDAFLADGNTVLDNCSLDSMSFTLVQESTDGNTCPQIVQRKYRIADECGNVAFSTQIITIDDEISPTFSSAAPGDTTIDCSATIPTAVSLSATDNCSTPMVEYTETSTQSNLGACSDYSYTLTRRWVATDSCDNFTVETQIITVQDTTPPSVSCCMNLTLSIGAEWDGIISLTPDDLNCGSTDDCTPDSLLTYLVSPNTFDQTDIGTQAVTLYVYDLCGNVDSCTVDVIITEDPEIGLAKRAVSVINNEDGSGTVTYEFNIENFGDVTLDSLQVIDSLENVFTGTCAIDIDAITSDDFKVNPNFGTAGDWQLLTGLDDLAAGDKGAILLTITVDSCGLNQGPYDNIALVSAVSPGDSTLTDLSVDGSNPDGPTIDNDPSDTSVTPVSFEENPSLGIAKRTVALTNNGDGSYTVLYEMNIENFGDVRLDSLQVLDSLDQVFASPCVLDVALTSDDFTVNAAFGTSDDWRLLNGTDDLPVGDQGAILLTVVIDSCAATGTFSNTVIASAKSPDGNEVSDNSVDGADPDPNGDSDPIEESVTDIVLTESPEIGGAKRVTQVTNNGDGSYTITYEFNIENFGDVLLSDIQAIDTLSNVFVDPCDLSIDELTSDDFTVNDDYGVANDWNLLSGSDALSIGDKGAVLLTITVDNCGNLGPFINQATVSGDSPTGETVSDETTNGSDPDGTDEDDNPDENATTTVSFEEAPVLGVAKRVSQGPASNGDGTYTMTFEIRVENNGNINLDSLQVTDDIDAVFGTDCDWTIDGLSSEEFTVNDSYNGDTNTNLLQGDDELKSWNEGAIYLTITAGTCSDLGPFTNSATATAVTPTGDDIMDVSQAGSEPDPDGDGDTDDNDVATSFEFEERPEIGGAKRVTQVTNNGDGSYTITYEFNIENFGDVLLSDIQATDTLSDVFVDPCALSIDELSSDDFTVNDDYGTANDWNLLSGSDDLPIGDKGAVLLTITVDNCGNLGPFINQATVSGDSPTGEMVTDETTNGSDPDGTDEDDNPDENAPTTVSFEEAPVLGVAKRVSQGPTSNGDGTYTMTFEIRVENNGNINLDSLQVTDNIDDVFGTDCDWTIDGLSSEEFTVNDSYNGDTNTNLLSGDDELKSWNEGAIYLTVTAGTCSDLGPFTNSATATAVTPTGDDIMDVSQTGSEPDPDGDGDTDDNDVATSFEFEERPVIGGAKRVTQVTNNGDGSYTITYEFNIENFGDVLLSDIQATDTLSDVFVDPCALIIDELTSDDFTVNADYGTANDWNLLSGSDDLPIGDKGAVLLTITVDNCGNLGPFINQATVSGDSPTGETVTDETTNGSDPDGTDEDDNPDENATTTVSFEESPVLGVAKRVSQGPTSNGDGTYTMTFEIRVENNGNINLDSLQVADDVDDVFGTDCDWTIDGLSSEEFTVNDSYNGDTNTNLLQGDDELKSWNEGAIYLTVTAGTCSDLGPFTNSATATAVTPTGDDIMDVSQTGSEPDPDGDGDTDDNDVATSFEFEESPEIGGAKRVTQVTNNGDGSYTITYEFNIENFGDVLLSDIQATDTLSDVFVDPCALSIDELSSDDFTVNADYGTAIDWNLLSGSDDLPIGDKGAVLLTITVDNCGNLGPFINQATVSGDSPTGETVTDETTNGSDPDGTDEDDNPDENATTTVSFEESPVLGVAKRVSQGPTSNGDGTYTMTFEIRVENNGNINLDSLQVADDVDDVFGTDCDWTIDGLSSEEFTVNDSYNGDTNTNLLQGDDELKSWNEGAIYLTVTAGTCSDLGPFTNSATATAVTPTGDDIMDVSQTGSEPDPDGDGDTDDNDVATSFEFEESPEIGGAKRVTQVTNNGDGSYTITYEFNIENFGDVLLSDIQATDTLSDVFVDPCALIIDELTSDDFTVNADYGTANDWNLLSGNDDLPIGDKGAVLLTITVDNCGNLGPFINQATVSGDSPTGETVTDETTNGSDPDGTDEDDNPDENATTTVSFEEAPVLGVAKRVSQGPISNGDGTYTMTFEIRVENNGNINLDSLQVTDDIDDVFGTDCDWTIDGLSSEEFTVNDSYNGDTNTNLLQGDDELKSWNEGAIYLTVTAGTCSDLGPFTNSATATSVTPTGDDIMDVSQTGSEPDPDGDGDTDDNDVATSFEFEEDAVIGIAKRPVEVINNPDGSATVTYEFNIENFGDVLLDSLQVRDSLFITFPGPCLVSVQTITSDDFTVNENFNGNTDFNLLSGTDDLPVGDKGAILIKILVENCNGNTGPFNNNAYADVVSPSGNSITDASTPGADADPNGDGNPDEAGPTLISFEQVVSIGLAKNVVTARSNPDGSFDITYEFNIEDFGTVELENVQLYDNLQAAFPSPCRVEVVEITSDNFTVNDDFDGVTVFEMLEGNDVLEVESKGAIVLEIQVRMCGSNLGPFNNTATVEADEPGGSSVSDNSTTGSEPDPNQNSNPDESEPTIVSFTEDPSLALTKRVSEGPQLDADNNYVLTYEIRAENQGDVNLEALAFYDTLANTFAGAEDWMIVSIESEEFAINLDYDGITNNNLIGAGEVLVPGAEGAIYLKVKVAPGGLPGPYLNSVTGIMITPFGTLVTDVSQDGTDPDPDDNDDPTDNSEETPVVLDCFVELICPAIVDTIRAENDLGWCRAVVNFPPAYVNTCAGAQDSLIEYRLEGVGAYNIPNDTWLPGQASGLSYRVGLTKVSMRASIPSQISLGYSTICEFHIEILDKEDPEILCQDITVPVGNDCDYVLTPQRLDAGTTDNCDEADELLFEISLDNETYVSSITFGLDDVIQSPIRVYLRVTDAAGNQAICTNEVNLEDETAPQILCPDDQIIYTEENLCVGLVPDLRPTLTIDNCAPIDTVIQTPYPGTLFGSSNNDQLDVVLTVVDIFGNTDTCGVRLTLVDTIAPTFINCPQPDIKVNTLPGMCGAFVNFTLPLAADNCAIDQVLQTDDTGLTSGEMFPVGTTILEFTAQDVAGNEVVCTMKVIVNDKALPTIDCVEDLSVYMDAGECGAIVDNISPSFSDNCEENLSVVYRLENEQGTLIESGISDASGAYFPAGTTRVQYRVQDQPLLLISEVTHELGATIGGTQPLPAFVNPLSAGEDFLEITNFGPSLVDVSCLSIERLHSGGSETLAVPRGVELKTGEVLTIHFGDGVDDMSQHYFNVEGAVDLASNAAAAYIISLSGITLDVAVLGQFFELDESTMSYVAESDWSGITDNSRAAIIRNTVWDTDGAADFSPVRVCQPSSIGRLNPNLPTAATNGASTALQAQIANRAICSFAVTVEDAEVPQCGSYDSEKIYESISGEGIIWGECFESIIVIDDQYDIADLNVHLIGNTAAFGNLSFSLTSPNGTRVELANGICGNSNGFNMVLDSDAPASIALQCAYVGSGNAFRPVNSVEVFNGEQVAGDWLLQIEHDGSLNTLPANLLSWSLAISQRINYDQENVALANDPGLCAADFSWRHPVLFDNCAGGTMEVEYRNGEGDLFSNGSIASVDWGSEINKVFPVGENTVTYLLTDEAGNETRCEFVVAVADEEKPILDCPDDMVAQLAPGDCEAVLPNLPNVGYDNCEIANISYDPPVDYAFPIGVTPVTITIQDAAGNTENCSFQVTVLEHIPTNPAVVCNDSLQITLGPDCTREVTADMILEGGHYRCYDNYEITIYASTATAAAVIPTSPVLTMNEVGSQVLIEICDPVTGTCCSGTMRVDFYQAPEFICPSDTLVSCNADLSPLFMGEPIVTSCVPGGANISYEDVIEEYDECDDPRVLVKRTWTVADGANNVAICVQLITIQAFDLAQIMFPIDLDNISLPALDCGEVGADPALTHPEVTGYPTVDGSTDVFGVNYCTASFIWSDEIYNICPGSYEILRTWKVRNSCGPVVPGLNPLTHIQVIKVRDADGPNMECPVDLTISTDPFACTATFELPIPNLTDMCSDATFTASISAGYLRVVDGVFTAYQLPIGSHEVTFIGRDECGKTASCSFMVTVEDQIAPTAICNEDLHISVGGEGYSRVYASSVDEGSNDFCGVDRMEVRRQYHTDADCNSVDPFMGAWGEYVEFSCCDSNDSIRIELRVIDIHGNENSCWLDVLIEDKSTPFCTPPHAVALACDDLPPGFDFTDIDWLTDQFGTATVSDNCSAVFVEELTPTIEINDCGEGRLIRHFTAVDESGNYSINACDQVIEISEQSHYFIKFPKDASEECGVPQPDTIATFELGCDLLAVSVEDEFFSASGDECYKILRTYQVINWCEYDGESPAIIVSRDEDCDLRAGDEDIWVLVDDNGTTYYDRDSIWNNSSPIANEKAGTCDGLRNPSGYWKNSQMDPRISSRGFWQYTQIIKVYDNEPPTIMYEIPDAFCVTNSETCEGNAKLAFTINDVCTPEDYTLTFSLDLHADGQVETDLDPLNVLSGVYPNFIIEDVFPIGKHHIEVKITDGCGNRNAKFLAFEVVDCKAPAPICIDGLAVELIPVAPGTDIDGDGLADPAAQVIWASDFIASEVSDCSGPVDYSLNRVGELPDRNQTSLTLTCRDIGTLAIEVYAWDNANNPYSVQVDGTVGGANFDYCETQISVQDNGSLCPGPGDRRIAGRIATEVDSNLMAVEVSISGEHNAMKLTDEDGRYDFEGLASDYDYSITPLLDRDYGNGLSTFDLILISKHILGIGPLDSPYKMIAADVNNSRSVTTLDVILLRKVILGIDLAFANNTSWRFVDKHYVFPDPSNPWLESFPEILSFNNLAGDALHQDFVAVKIGDVTLNARTNPFHLLEERSPDESFGLITPDLTMRAQQVYEVPISAIAMDEITGFQFGLSFDPSQVELLGIDYHLLQAEHLGLRWEEDGIITLSWHEGKASKVGEQSLFKLRFRARKEVDLKEVLGLTSRKLKGEAYRNSGEILAVSLDYGKPITLPDHYELFQNEPNPFAKRTRIQFQLPTRMEAILQFMDTNGKILKTIRDEFDAGKHEVILKAETFKGHGIIYYTLIAGPYTQTRKMIQLQ